jgi:hypothetical protein
MIRTVAIGVNKRCRAQQARFTIDSPDNPATINVSL